MKYTQEKLFKIVDNINKKYFSKPVKVKSICFEEMPDFWALADNISNKRPSLDIAIKNSLKTAPQYVIEYLLYHEMLHTYKQYHSVSFCVRERMYSKYNKAVTWLYRVNFKKCDPKNFQYIIKYMFDKELLSISDIAHAFNSTPKVIKKYL